MPLSDAHAPLAAMKAELFKSLAHPVRVRVLEVLAEATDGTAAVSTLLEETGVEASSLSQHLSVLRSVGVVTSTRNRNGVDYQLSEPLVSELLVVARRFLVSRLDRTSAHLGVPGAAGATEGTGTADDTGQGTGKGTR